MSADQDFSCGEFWSEGKLRIELGLRERRERVEKSSVVRKDWSMQLTVV